MLEPSQLLDAPLVEAVDRHVPEERVSGALRDVGSGECLGRLKPMPSPDVASNLHDQIQHIVPRSVHIDNVQGHH